MEDNCDSGERSVRRSKRLEVRKTSEETEPGITAEETKEVKDTKGKKRKLSSPSDISPSDKGRYKLRKFSSPEPSLTRDTSGDRLGNSRSSPESNSSPAPSSSKKKAEVDAGSSAGSSTMTAPQGEGPALPPHESDEEASSADDDIARLQNLLEARGVPAHLLSSLGPRMHLILNRTSSTLSRAHTLLHQLQSKQEPQQLQACIDLCQMLVMGNEETLAGFPVRQSVPLLVGLLAVEHNMLLMHHACRALTYLMESLPRSTVFVVEAVPSLLLKLKSIQCMDVAEQALTALEMLSKKHAKIILQAGGVSACLCYVDFFSLNAQRSALNITANCCNVVTPEDSELFMESIPTLTAKLTSQDKKLLESCCLTFSRLVEQLKSDSVLLMQLCNEGLLTNLQQLLLVGSPSVMSSNVFVMVLHILSTVFHHCTSLATEFIKQDACGTVRCLLLGNKAPVQLSITPTLIPRSSSELFEILGLCSELLPQLPKYGVFSVDNLLNGLEEERGRQWYSRDGEGQWQPFSKSDNKAVNNSCDAGETEVCLSFGGQPVTVDLSTMLLEFEESGETQAVTHSRKKHFLPDLLQSSTFKDKDKDKEDCRLTLLRDEPALYAELCQTMLVLLFEVYRGSASPNVRYKCLHCLLRIIYHSRSESIKNIATELPLSSTVAGMLSSQDSRLVIYGLQLSEILMKKLPAIFAVNFRKEGVMHAVKKIITESSPPLPSSHNSHSTDQTSPTRSQHKIRSVVSSPPKSVIFPPIPSLPGEGLPLGRTTRSRSRVEDTPPDDSTSSFKRLGNALRRRHRPPPLKKKSYKSKLTSSISPPSLPCPGPPTKEELQQWVRQQADKFCQKYLSDETDKSSNNLNMLNRAVQQLADCTDASESDVPLKQIKQLLVDGSTLNALSGPLSSFELLHAGLVDALLTFLTPQATDKDIKSDVIHRVMRLLEVFVFGEHGEFEPSAFSTLVTKLQSCLGQLEHFPVKVNDCPGDTLGKMLSTHQIKCMLRRHPDNANIRQWGGGPVKVDPLAYVQALEKYLIVRGYCQEGEESSSDASEEEGEEGVISRQQSVIARHKLQLSINNNVLPYNMTMYQAIKKYGTHTRLDDDAHPVSHSAVWHSVHTVTYKPMDGAHSSAPVREQAAPEEQLPPSSIVEKLGFSPPHSIDNYQGMQVVELLHVLHTISQEWSLLLETNDYHNPIITGDELVSPQITAKVERQLQDPLVVMTSEFPRWLVPLPYYAPFLFPFNTRQFLLHTTAFDRDRALQRLQESHPELSLSTAESRTGIRLNKEKRCLERSKVFLQGEEVMKELASSRSLLEVYYIGEVGTGLGPTLEFYTLISQGFQESIQGMWRGDTVLVENGGEMVEYVNPVFGLYPKPICQTDSADLRAICARFKYLGMIMGKSLIDHRILDIPFSQAFHRWLLDTQDKMGLATLKEVDPILHSSLKRIELFALEKAKILKNEALTEEAKHTAIQDLTDSDGCTLDDLCLDFLVPGTDLELKAGGAEIPLTVNNVEEYLCSVVDFVLKDGVRSQMSALKEGFSLVMPLSKLRLFYTDELTKLFCGTDEAKWGKEELSTSLQPDHGYTASSTALTLLIEVMTNLTAKEQRAFLQFVTGSPKLPVGGFKSLHPRLTVVKKTVDGHPDSYLPSVMTCVNYLKLPDYTNANILKEKLLVAIAEGQNSFHLS